MSESIAAFKKRLKTPREVRAREIHAAWCRDRTDGYQGPCWGPTADDFQRADEQLDQESNGSGS